MTDLDPSQPLKNTKWEKFCQLVAGGMGVTDAYEGAGFKRDRKNADHLRQRYPVSTRIEYLQKASAEQVIGSVQEAIEASGLSREWVITRLMENVERSMQAVPVTVAGIPTGEYKYDGAVANKALEVLGKVVGIEGSMADKPDEDAEAAKSTADPRVADAIAGVKRARLHLVASGGKKAE